MTFIDTNVFMYAVGKPHPLKGRARAFFRESVRDGARLCTSAEVVQELMHAYLPVAREHDLDQAMRLIAKAKVEVWPLEGADLTLARQLHERFPKLGARDLCHLASCRRRRTTNIKTFDRTLAEAAGALT